MVDLRRDLGFGLEGEAVDADLRPGSGSFGAEEGRRAEKEREEGMMEAREDLLEVMSGNMTTGSQSVSVQVQASGCSSTMQ